jgi:hypothetical protein
MALLGALGDLLLGAALVVLVALGGSWRGRLRAHQLTGCSLARRVKRVPGAKIYER